MNTFVVHVSDAHRIDKQSKIYVADSMDVGRAAQLALDELIDRHGAKLTFPLFIDIQLCSEFQGREWMYSPGEVPLTAR